MSKHFDGLVTQLRKPLNRKSSTQRRRRARICNVDAGALSLLGLRETDPARRLRKPEAQLLQTRTARFSRIVRVDDFPYLGPSVDARQKLCCSRTNSTQQSSNRHSASSTTLKLSLGFDPSLNSWLRKATLLFPCASPSRPT